MPSFAQGGHEGSLCERELAAKQPEGLTENAPALFLRRGQLLADFDDGHQVGWRVVACAAVVGLVHGAGGWVA